MTFPSFSVGEVLTAADMNAVGLWKVASGTLTGVTTTGSNVTSVFTNANYQHYRVLIQVTNASISNRLQMRMLSGTTPAQTGAYYAGGVASDWAANTTLYFQRSNADTSLLFTNTNAALNRYIDFTLYAPNQARATMFSGTYIDSVGLYSYAWGGAHNVATAYDGFQLLTNTGTMDVNYVVYGLKP